MQIEKLILRGWRNYREAEFSPSDGVNLLLGSNAQGKTNLLEAIFYLSAGKSFRTHKESELCGFDCDEAEVEADVFTQERTQNLRAVLFPDRRPRRLFLSGIRQKTFSEMAGKLTTVLFCPEDLYVLRGGSAGRRRLIDAALSQISLRYSDALSEYTRFYEGKSRILRDRETYPSLLDALPEYSDGLCRCGAVLLSLRARYLAALADKASAFHGDFSGGKERLSLTYHTVSSVTDPMADEKTILSQLREHMQSHREAELASGQCLSGVHKDDFESFLGELPLRSFGSQGQTRTAAISIKLAERELLRQKTGENPVLLLDDVLSELDGRRQDYLLNRLKSGQVFITCCETDRLTALGRTFSVENGTIRSL